MLKIIKTWLKGVKRACPEELPNVLWAYRTTTRVLIGEMPLRLTFGTEAIIPVEVRLTSLRDKTYKGQKNQQGLNNNLDLINEVREEAMKRMAKHKEAMAKYYNRKVNIRRFNTGDLVLRKISQATKDPSQGNWDQLGKTPTK